MSTPKIYHKPLRTTIVKTNRTLTVDYQEVNEGEYVLSVLEWLHSGEEIETHRDVFTDYNKGAAVYTALSNTLHIKEF